MLQYSVAVNVVKEQQIAYVLTFVTRRASYWCIVLILHQQVRVNLQHLLSNFVPNVKNLQLFGYKILTL